MALSFDSGDGGLLSVDSHRVVPAPFLTKTYQLVDDHLSDDIVSWGEDGSTFVVWRPPEFARDLLPNYFKHNNFSSFVRQLNTYGFRKVVPDRWEFANDFFKKGERHLLCEIHRRKSQSGSMIPGGLIHYGSSSLSPTTSGEEHVAASAWGSSLTSSPLQSPRGICNGNTTMVMGGGGHHHSGAAAASVMSLSDENERLRRDNCLLLTELSRLQKQYDDAVMFLQQNMRLSGDDLRRLRSQQQQQQFQMFNGSTRTTLMQPQQQQQQQHHGNDFYHQSIWAKVATTTPGAATMVVPPTATAAAAASKFMSGSDAAAPKASTIDFVDGKLREMAHHGALKVQPLVHDLEDLEGSSPNAGTRLFGVVLQGRKRAHEEDISSSSSKIAKSELELMPHPAATDAPWLKFRAARDVC